ncbi:hypothetical protein CspeluHIS016_0305290 [Cutaneotrichosporon spelunceum]|uniref:EVE domain-containing protein n=1 Tax=Cutaneotrichosporon spelunceum TaxID=1672016 RepID=A0AAD3TUD6_9TREE|nr:hypothetical protein CspeluHIS016_0305290 [Cutaneotrichosporon spelunceum]
MPWLIKAEPDTRLVKGQDVKFSVDDFEEMGESPWDGVRNHEAKNIMRDKMKIGDKVLFYHSNCKVPGVYALAEVVREGYPDYTAWDATHPYFDARSDPEHPTWFMVTVAFRERLAHPVTLAGVKSLVGLSTPPDGVAYIGESGLRAVQGMALVNRGRLSVQPVEDEAYEAIIAMGRRGGFEEPTKGKGKRVKEEPEDHKPAESKSPSKEPPPKKAKAEPKSKAEPKPNPESKPRIEGARRSSRLQK